MGVIFRFIALNRSPYHLEMSDGQRPNIAKHARLVIKASMEGKIVVLCEHVSGFHGQTGITPPRRAISFRRFTRKTSYIRFTLGNKNTRMCRHVRTVQPDLQRTPRRGEGGGTPPPSPMHGGHGNCGPPGLPPFLFPASAQSARFTHTTHTHNAHPLKGKQRGTYPPPCVFPRRARERDVSHPCFNLVTTPFPTYRH